MLIIFEVKLTKQNLPAKSVEAEHYNCRFLHRSVQNLFQTVSPNCAGAALHWHFFLISKQNYESKLKPWNYSHAIYQISAQNRPYLNMNLSSF